MPYKGDTSEDSFSNHLNLKALVQIYGKYQVSKKFQ